MLAAALARAQHPRRGHQPRPAGPGAAAPVVPGRRHRHRLPRPAPRGLRAAAVLCGRGAAVLPGRGAGRGGRAGGPRRRCSARCRRAGATSRPAAQTAVYDGPAGPVEVGYRLDRAGALAGWWVRAVDPRRARTWPASASRRSTDDHPPVAVVSAVAGRASCSTSPACGSTFDVHRVGDVSYVDSPRGLGRPDRAAPLPAARRRRRPRARWSRRCPARSAGCWSCPASGSPPATCC